MTDTTKAQILAVARKAIHTEMLTLKHLEETLGDEFAAAVELILESRGKCIITGMGKSGLVGRKIAATLASTGTPSFFLHPGEAFHGDLGMISKEDIVSRSPIRARRTKSSRSSPSSTPTATSWFR